MGVERYVVEATVREGRSRRDVAHSTGLSKTWVDKLVARYVAGGVEALTPRSHRPKSCSHAAPPEVKAAVLELRHQLGEARHDNGPHTIAHHLRERFPDVPSVATV